MKVSSQWLSEWVSVSDTPEDLAERLTLAGLEVDSVAPVAPPFTGVMVARVEAVNPHPDADKLRVCEVNDGAQHIQIVCGAPNVREGMLVPLAAVLMATIAAPVAVCIGGDTLAAIQAAMRWRCWRRYPLDGAREWTGAANAGDCAKASGRGSVTLILFSDGGYSVCCL